MPAMAAGATRGTLVPGCFVFTVILRSFGDTAHIQDRVHKAGELDREKESEYSKDEKGAQPSFTPGRSCQQVALGDHPCFQR